MTLAPSLRLPWLVPLSVAWLVACNNPPGPATITLSPAAPFTTDDLTVVFLSQAADSNPKDTVSYHALWYVDGVQQPDLSDMTVAAEQTTKGEVWKVIVVPTDGVLDGPPVASEVIIGNTPPVAEVSVDIPAPLSNEDVTATASGTDDDGDALEFAYTWTQDGGPEQQVEGATLSALKTEKGQVWTVSAVATDGEDDSDPATASVSIENVLPVVDSVAIDPTEPVESSTLTAQVFETDADGDTVTFHYVWWVDGLEVQAGAEPTLTGALFDKHQAVSVIVTPNDGFADGAPLESDPVTVLNSPPTLTGAALDPADIYEATTVTCVPSGWSDDDGDPEGTTYAWSVDGADPGVTAATLDGAAFNRGQSVSCAATPNDGETDGTSVFAAAVVVSNTAPVLADVTLSPASPHEEDTITAAIGTTTDDDGDTVTYSYEWTVNGTSTLTGSTFTTLSGLYFAKGDVISVTVIPNDGTDEGLPVTSAAVTAVNSTPVVDSVSFSPSVPYTDTLLTVSAAASDADGDAVSLQYAWSSDAGTDLSGETGPTLDGASTPGFAKNETITVMVTPVETAHPSAIGAPVTATTLVLNTPPTAPGVAITPLEPFGGIDDLVCSVDTPSTDADGDALTYAFSWEVDGAPYGGTVIASSSTIAGAETTTGEAWSCSVRANDGTGAAAVVSVQVTPSEITHPGGGRMISISAGTFDMGCTPGQSSCSSDETVHTVTLTHDFYMGVTEVTAAEYQAVIGSDPSSYTSCGTSCPVNEVSWHDVAAYANALSAAVGLDDCFTCAGGTCTTAGDPYTCNGYRLPTEAEWEYAARGGKTCSTRVPTRLMMWVGTTETAATTPTRSPSWTPTHGACTT